MALTPFSCDIVGWRGAPATGAYCFVGGLLVVISGVLEWVLGNKFPFLVFCAYGCYWLPFSSTLTPSIGAYGHHSTSFSDMDSSAGLTDSIDFPALFAFFRLTMGFLPLMVAICCLRTSIRLGVVESASPSSPPHSGRRPR